MFVKYEVGDRVFHKILREEGKVVMVKRNFCVVHIPKEDGGVLEVSPHFHDIVKITDENTYVKDEYNPVKMLADFHKAFKYERSEKPVALSAEEVFKRIVFIQEELIELLAASVDTVDEFNEYFDKLQDKEEEAYHKERPKVSPKDGLERIIAQTDALVDILYFTYGTADQSGVDVRPPFKIVQTANMHKLNPETGEPIYNEFGKIQKPEGWSENYAPEQFIEEEIKAQIKEAEDK